MNYTIHITGSAKRDINEAADYIEYTLLNPKAADNLINLIENAINQLAFMPEKYSLVNDPVLSLWGIRMIVINNYLAFYAVDKKAKAVYIIRFLYGKRNWISILSKDMVNVDWTVEIHKS